MTFGLDNAHELSYEIRITADRICENPENAAADIKKTPERIYQWADRVHKLETYINGYGLYIYSDSRFPEIHVFPSVDAARAYVLELCKRLGVELDDQKVEAADDGFFVEGTNAGRYEFECRKIIRH